jgi:hypothetical protein
MFLYKVMRKEIYLIKGLRDESYEDFSKRILSLGSSILKEDSNKRIKVNFTKKAPPRISIIPFRKEKIAAISIYDTNNQSSSLLEKQQGFSGRYKVEEAVPLAYEKTWSDFEETPGECLLTLFKQKKGITYKTFIDRWHNGHTPLSLKIHPLWNYNRNLVTESLLAENYKWDGIVEEQTRTASDLLNPFSFFGNPFIIIYRLLLVYFDTNSFLDYKTIETYLSKEVWIKS